MNPWANQKRPPFGARKYRKPVILCIYEDLPFGAPQVLNLKRGDTLFIDDMEMEDFFYMLAGKRLPEAGLIFAPSMEWFAKSGLSEVLSLPLCYGIASTERDTVLITETLTVMDWYNRQVESGLEHICDYPAGLDPPKWMLDEIRYSREVVGPRPSEHPAYGRCGFQYLRRENDTIIYLMLSCHACDCYVARFDRSELPEAIF